jgi:hypothetical protein
MGRNLRSSFSPGSGRKRVIRDAAIGSTDHCLLTAPSPCSGIESVRPTYSTAVPEALFAEYENKPVRNRFDTTGASIASYDHACGGKISGIKEVNQQKRHACRRAESAAIGQQMQDYSKSL